MCCHVQEGGGGGFDEHYGGELALHSMDFSDPSQQCVNLAR